MWLKLKQDMLSYGDSLKQSKFIARNDVKDGLIHLQDEIFSMKRRWDFFSRSGYEAVSNDEVLNELNQFKNEIQSLKTKVDESERYGAYLDMIPIDSSPCIKLYEDIMSQCVVCETLTGYDRELSVLGEAQWKKMQPQSLDAFVKHWKPYMNSFDSSFLSEKMFKSLSLIESIVSILNHCCGNIFNDDHWAELFYDIIGIAARISVNEVTLKEIMKVLEEKPLSSCMIDSIKKLSSR